MTVAAAAPCTPRAVTRQAIGCDATPGADARYPHYCPLCMMSFSRALATTCCRNTLCEVCAREVTDAAAAASPLHRRLHHGRHLEKPKGALPFDLDGRFVDDIGGVLRPVVAVACPFCSAPMQLKPVLGAVAVKFYGDSPRPAQPSPSPALPGTVMTPRASLSGDPGRASIGSNATGPRAPSQEVDNARPGEVGALSPVPFTLGAGQSATERPVYGQQTQLSSHSPVRQGDEFAALRRKMRPFDAELPPLPPLPALPRPEPRESPCPDDDMRNPLVAPGAQAQARREAMEHGGGSGRYPNAPMMVGGDPVLRSGRRPSDRAQSEGQHPLHRLTREHAHRADHAAWPGAYSGARNAPPPQAPPRQGRRSRRSSGAGSRSSSRPTSPSAVRRAASQPQREVEPKKDSSFCVVQ